MSLFIFTKAAHQEKLSDLGLYLHRGGVAELIVSLWVPEHKPGKSCAKAALGYPSSHQSCQEPAAVVMDTGCGAGVSSQHMSSVSPGGDTTSLTLLGLCMGRSSGDELRVKREYTLVWESPKYCQKVRWLLEACFGNPFLPLPWGYQPWRWHSGLGLSHTVTACALPERIIPMVLLNLWAEIGKIGRSFFKERKKKYVFCPV